MKQRILAVALIVLLILSGCKKPPVEEQAFDAVAEDPISEEQTEEQPKAPLADSPSEEEEKIPSEEQQPEEELEEEPTEEQKEEETPEIPMTVQQVHPLKGRVHTLSREDHMALKTLLEGQEWGEKNLLYQVHDYEITMGEQTYRGYFGHRAVNTADGGTRLNDGDRQTLLQLLEKYIGVYKGAPTVEQMNSDAPRRVMSEEDWFAVRNVLSQASEDAQWGPTPPEFQGEFLMLFETFGFYYDSTAGMISMGNSARFITEKEQATLEQMLSKYLKPAG